MPYHRAFLPVFIFISMTYEIPIYCCANTLKESTYMKINRVSMILAGVAALLFLVIGGTASAATATAQSAMFDNEASGNFVITGDSVYSYNKDTAATYFTNAWNGVVPTPTCTGGGSGGVNCSSGNQPATPSAPDPDANKLNGHIGCNSCNFWDGSALSLSCAVGTTPYTQDVTLSGLNTKGNWKYTFTYNIGFSAAGDAYNSAPVALTAWDLQSSSTTNADVTVEGFFAGQSTQLKNTGSGGWSFKASHTMLDSLGASRLVGATATITDADANVICTLPIVTHVVSGEDFTYLGNAGRNGTLINLFDNGITPNGTVNDIQNGVSTALNGRKDDFAGNNGTGGDQAVIDSDSTGTCSISAAGNYTLNVTGTLKGVSGASSLPVSVSSSICISAGTCSVCP
jgi:hypothetical protein